MQTYVLKAGAITVRGNLIYTPAHKPHDGGKHFAAMAENHKVDGCAIKYMGGYEINDLAKSVYTEREISWLKKEQSFWAICTRFSNGLEFLLLTTLIISKKPGNTGISRDIRTEFTTDLLLSD